MTNPDNKLIAKFSAAANAQTPQTSETESLSIDSPTQLNTANNTSPIPSINPLDIPRNCFNHIAEEGKYFCPVCCHWRCNQCVKTYGGVAVCPDSDSFCLTIEKLTEQVQAQSKKAITYKTFLIQATVFPFRKWLSSLILWIVIWGLAAFLQLLTNIANTPPIGKIFFGPFVDVSPCAICFLFLSSIATQYLLNRVHGKETLKFLSFSEGKDFAEPIVLWFCTALISLAPILVHLIYHNFQPPKITLTTNIAVKSLYLWGRFYFLTTILSLWAITSYPLLLASAGLQRSLVFLMNPFNLFSVWRGFKEWLIPAIGIFYLLHIFAFILMFFLSNVNYGLGVLSLVFSLTTISSFMVIGTAMEYGAEKHHQQEQQEKELEKQQKQQEQQQNQAY